MIVDDEGCEKQDTKRHRAECQQFAVHSPLRLAMSRGNQALEPHLLVIFAAQSLKLWEGLGVELVEAASDAEAIALVFRGEAQAACCDYLPLLQHWTNGYQSRVLCSPTRVGLLSGQLHPVLFTSDKFEHAEPNACLYLARGVIRAARQLHDDFASFTQTARLLGKCNAVSFVDGELFSMWQQFTQASVFAVNGAISRTHWGPRLEEALTTLSVNDGSSICYEHFIAYIHVTTALRKLGRHPSLFDAV